MSQGIQKNRKLTTRRDPQLLAVAQGLLPTLHQNIREAVSLVNVIADPCAIHGWRAETVGTVEELSKREWTTRDEFIVDFGTHCVGYLHLRCETAGSPPDAPAHLRFIFGETPVEMAEPFSGYDGWLSSSWLQQEDLYLDVLPAQISLPRRYCCRYVKIKVMATSSKFQLRFSDLQFQSVTSADSTTLMPLIQNDPLLNQIDQVGVLTLRNCMQEVFEDGPKRDRRLWLGDLRLEALVNYHTFRQNDLVKRCLYLFASVTRDDGMVSSNLFMQPDVIADDTFLFDYALFFVATLADYVAATGDEQTLSALWPTAWRQIELAMQRVDSRGIVRDGTDWWSFIDWHEDLNKQAPSQGVLIYCLEKARPLAEITDAEKIPLISNDIDRLKAAALTHLWHAEQGFFISGAARQVSYASQVWLVLAGVGDASFRRELVTRLFITPPAVKIKTPYMMHHFIEALLSVNEQQRATEEIKKYWGGMVQEGADTFWELFDPEHPDFSPYGSKLINSYCHAWSCTPAYFIRKYGL